jgi:hypothetical protein
MARICPMMLIGRPEAQSECIEKKCMWYNEFINECVFPAMNRSLFKLIENKDKP